MATEFKVEIKGLEKLEEAMMLSPKTVARVLDQAIKRSGAILSMNTNTQTVPYGVSGFLIQRFSAAYGFLTVSWAPHVKYAGDVEFGTAPHKIPYGSSDFASLTAWCLEKGLNPYAVRNSIAVHGTKANPYMERIRSRSRDDIDKTFRETIMVITKALSSNP